MINLIKLKIFVNAIFQLKFSFENLSELNNNSFINVNVIEKT